MTRCAKSGWHVTGQSEVNYFNTHALELDSPGQAVVDRPAQPVIGDRRDGDGLSCGIGAVQCLEQMRRRLDQIARPRPALDQRLLQPLAVVGRIAQAEPLPLILGQAAPFQIFARRLAGRPPQVGREPLLRQVHPVGQALLSGLALGRLRVLGRQGQTRFARQPRPVKPAAASESRGSPAI